MPKTAHARRPVARKPTIVDLMMNEITNYGGLLMPRWVAYRLAKEHLGPEHSKEPFGAWYFALHGPAVILTEGERAFTYEEAREIMK